MIFKKFIRKEKITFLKLFNPIFVYKILFKYRFIHFFITGASGALIALFIIWLLTEFIFGQENYFSAYLVGLMLNLSYNFILHTRISFKTKKHHIKRFIIFIIYNLLMASFQAFIVKTVTPLIGIPYYLFVIAGTIFIFSIINFLVCKFYVFFER